MRLMTKRKWTPTGKRHTLVQINMGPKLSVFVQAGLMKGLEPRCACVSDPVV